MGAKQRQDQGTGREREERQREKNIGWIKRLFTAWRVSHAERKEAGEDDPEEDETPVEIPPSAFTIYPKGTPVPTPTVEVQVLETRVDLSNDMTGRDMIAVGVRNVVLARGMLDKLEGPKYAERRAELRRKAREAARARDRQTTAASQTRPRRAMSQGKRQQERERREWEEREVA